MRPKHSHSQKWLCALALCASVVGLASLAGSAAFAASSAPDTDTGAAPKELLVLPFDMVDTSLQGEMNNGPLKADVARLHLAEKVAHQAIAEQPEFRVISTDDVQPEISKAHKWYRYLYNCNGCEIDIGKKASADLVMTGWAQKVSNLILNLNAKISDVSTGKTIVVSSVDMRSNTDDSWQKAAKYLVERTLMANYRSKFEGGATSHFPRKESGK